jgi:hypothetical protein
LEAKKNRILALYGLMDGTADELAGDPDVVMCVDEFGPLNLQPHPGRQWTTRAGGGPSPRRRRRATSTRPHGVRHLGAADDLSRDKLYGAHQAGQAPRRVPRLPALPEDSVPADGAGRDRAGQPQPHLSTADDARVGDWAAASNLELAYVPTNASWRNRIQAQVTALRSFTLDGTDHESHHQQATMIRRYLAWRNRHAHDQPLGYIVKRANVA